LLHIGKTFPAEFCATHSQDSATNSIFLGALSSKRSSSGSALSPLKPRASPATYAERRRPPLPTTTQPGPRTLARVSCSSARSPMIRPLPLVSSTWYVNFMMTLVSMRLTCHLPVRGYRPLPRRHPCFPLHIRRSQAHFRSC
jgi:hypothetical protein